MSPSAPGGWSLNPLRNPDVRCKTGADCRFRKRFLPRRGRRHRSWCRWLSRRRRRFRPGSVKSSVKRNRWLHSMSVGPARRVWEPLFPGRNANPCSPIWRNRPIPRFRRRNRPRSATKSRTACGCSVLRLPISTAHLWIWRSIHDTIRSGGIIASSISGQCSARWIPPSHAGSFWISSLPERTSRPERLFSQWPANRISSLRRKWPTRLCRFSPILLSRKRFA